MTNATACESTSRPVQFVGVDMAQKAFDWTVHGEQGTHSLPNEDSGFEALLAALKHRRIGLIVIEATGRTGVRT